MYWAISKIWLKPKILTAWLKFETDGSLCELDDPNMNPWACLDPVGRDIGI
jgi:hypothetical protein